MKHLAKTIVLVSMASLLALSSTAEAKHSREHQGKRAKAAVQEQDIPWYEQDLVPATTKVAPQKKAKKKVTTGAAPTLDRLGYKQRRRTVLPSGLCNMGCDKSARQISLTKIVLVADAKDPNAQAVSAAKTARAIKAAEAAKVRAAKAKALIASSK